MGSGVAGSTLGPQEKGGRRYFTGLPVGESTAPSPRLWEGGSELSSSNGHSRCVDLKDGRGAQLWCLPCILYVTFHIDPSRRV